MILCNQLLLHDWSPRFFPVAESGERGAEFERLNLQGTRSSDYRGGERKERKGRSAGDEEARRPEAVKGISILETAFSLSGTRRTIRARSERSRGERRRERKGEGAGGRHAPAHRPWNRRPYRDGRRRRNRPCPCPCPCPPPSDETLIRRPTSNRFD